MQTAHNNRPTLFLIVAGILIALAMTVGGCAAWFSDAGRDAFAATGESAAETANIQDLLARIRNKATDPNIQTLADAAMDATIRQQAAQKRAEVGIKALSEQCADLNRQLQSVLKGWGYRFQCWVEMWKLRIEIYIGLMLAMKLAGLFVSGPVGGILSVVGTAMNPAAWLHSAADNAFFRGWTPGGKSNAATGGG